MQLYGEVQWKRRFLALNGKGNVNKEIAAVEPHFLRPKVRKNGFNCEGRGTGKQNCPQRSMTALKTEISFLFSPTNRLKGLVLIGPLDK